VHQGNTYLFLVPIYGTLLLGERIAHAVIKPGHDWNNWDTTANILITLTTLGLNTVIGHLLPLAVMALLYEWGHVVTLGHGLGGWLLGFLLYDLAWYVDHRFGHRIGFLWAMHHVHHSSPEYNMTVASRGFIVDTTLLPRPTFYLLPLLGVSPFHFIVISICTNIWGIVQHTRLVGKLGWLDWVFATPSNHRVHHGSDEKYIDKNYGEVLILWDRLLGTYQAEEEEPIYGVTTPINTCHFVRVELAGLQWMRGKISDAGSWQDKVRCFFMPPEWLPQKATPVEGTSS
jgi:sterol desaturase/sphingolipid hydroxylase (fatty acid hydroxylase superfamily)